MHYLYTRQQNISRYCRGVEQVFSGGIPCRLEIMVTSADGTKEINHGNMKVAIFCSANENIEPVYFEKTRELGEWLAKNGDSIVFGGCDMGLMECVAKAAYEAGGMTIGVVPSKIEENGHVSQYLSVEIPCDNLSDRKDLMLLKSDVVVALPGGLGTLDEIFTVAASSTIGYHNKRVILYNINGFWNTFIALLDDLQQRGMIRGDYHRHIEIADSFEQLKQLLG